MTFAETIRALRECPLGTPFAGQHGVCVRCGGPLPSKRHRWCSEACVDGYLGNHEWNAARFEAIHRAKGLISRARCDECGRETDAPEVNHVEPRNGAGYDKGCHNHQTNLQVLCHPCHVAETTRQIRERRGVPEGGRPEPVRVDPLPPMDSLWEAAS